MIRRRGSVPAIVRLRCDHASVTVGNTRAFLPGLTCYFLERHKKLVGVGQGEGKGDLNKPVTQC